MHSTEWFKSPDHTSLTQETFLFLACLIMATGREEPPSLPPQPPEPPLDPLLLSGFQPGGPPGGRVRAGSGVTAEGRVPLSHRSSSAPRTCRRQNPTRHLSAGWDLAFRHETKFPPRGGKMKQANNQKKRGKVTQQSPGKSQRLFLLPARSDLMY